MGISKICAEEFRLLWLLRAVAAAQSKQAECSQRNSTLVELWVQVPHNSSGNVIRVNCKWSNTANTIQAISMDEDDDLDNVLDSIDQHDSMQVLVHASLLTLLFAIG